MTVPEAIVRSAETLQGTPGELLDPDQGVDMPLAWHILAAVTEVHSATAGPLTGRKSVCT